MAVGWAGYAVSLLGSMGIHVPHDLANPPFGEERGIFNLPAFIVVALTTFLLTIGTKARQLTLASRGRYRPGRVLMIGDAPGDLAAAQEAGTLFYPVIPGREDEAWRCFHDEACDRFLGGTYAGAYADGLCRAFLDALPDTPPWQTAPRRGS